MSEPNGKVAIIGSGNVGANTALLTALLGVADIALVDIADGLAEGRALDISQALAILQLDDRVTGGSDFKLIEGADVVVITAGSPRAPGMSRVDLLHKNATAVKAICAEIKKRTPDAIVVVVTNPVDIMTYLAWRETGFKPQKVFGMGGLLDSGRFTHFLSVASGALPSSTKAIVIGSHDDNMVPVASLANMDKRRFRDLIGKESLSATVDQTKHGGAQIVKLLKTGSAAYGPAAALSTMLNAIIVGDGQNFSVCCQPHGEYGLRDIYINLPAKLGAGGVEQIIELKISGKEKKALELGASSIRDMLKELD
ncbi:MAG TPA: malate dehydrogenase [Actinobacteria bacterium]|nr:malate dehydrogenase [Actinomycetota bacterium]